MIVPTNILAINIVAISRLQKDLRFIKYTKEEFNRVVDYFMVKDCVIGDSYCRILGVEVMINE